MWMNILRGVVAGVIVVAVCESARHSVRFGALMIALPVVSMLALTFTWLRYGDSVTISRVSLEALVLVPLSLPFFVPLILMNALGLNYWSALALGLLLSAASLGTWVVYGPRLT